MSEVELRHVLTPTSIGTIELRNRVVRTAYGTNLGRGELNEDLIAHHEARARGGVALSVLEATGVHRSCPMTLNGWDDSILPRYAALAQRMHSHGMKIFGQLNHLGLAGAAPGGRPWSASPLVSAGGKRALSIAAGQIEEIVAAFALAAQRTREGGLDGVEIHCAHGHLIQQFLSPVTNLRSDDYGGDWSGRVRLLHEVVARCREAVGPDFVLGVRVGPEAARMRISSDDCIRVVLELEKLKLIDYVSISQGSFYVPEKIIGAMHEPAGYELEQSTVIASATALPTIVTGRVRTLAEADRILADGYASLVGMTRAHIADPELISKTTSARVRAVRPCIACNQGCVGGLERGRLGCSVNPLAGRELSFKDFDRPAPASRRVVIIGGGPAGMEAARVAALRGHAVTLFESQDALGGALRIARGAPSHHLIGDIADWLADQLLQFNVDVRLGTRAEAAAIAALSPDVVILACGVSDSVSSLSLEVNGHINDSSRIQTARQFLDSENPTRVKAAVVVDELGGYEAIGAAERLIESGARVGFVTGFSSFAPRLESALVTQPALHRLRRGNFELLTGARIVEARDNYCTVAWLEGGATRRLESELIVIASPGEPDERLAANLASLHVPILTIGEGRSPGTTLENALREGHDAAMRVGT